MDAAPRCQWCRHIDASHGLDGCEVVLCECELSASDLGGYALALALEELRIYWAA